MSRLFVIVASPRSGSTNLQRVLQSFASVETFGEAFNPNGGMDSNRVAEIAEFKGVQIEGDIRNFRKTITDIRRRDPRRGCEEFIAFSQERGASYSCFKILPGHLSAPQIQDITEKFRPVFIFLFREPIDIFISLQKAKLLGTYRRADTTNIFPELNFLEFRAWKWKQNRHYKMAYCISRSYSRPALMLNYKDFFLSDKNPQDELRTRMLEIGIDLGSINPMYNNFMSIQDKGETREMKISNWDSFFVEVQRDGDPVEILEKYEDLNLRDFSLDLQLFAERFVGYETKRKMASAYWSIRSKFYNL